MVRFFGRELSPEATRGATWALLFLFVLGALLLAVAGDDWLLNLLGAVLLLGAVTGFAVARRRS